MKLKNILLVVCVLFLTIQANAQGVRSRYFSLGPAVGSKMYIGDLSDGKPWNSSRIAFGGMMFYHFNPHMAFRISGSHGWVAAADSNSANSFNIDRNAAFKTHITEFSAQVVYEFFKTAYSYKYRPKFTPYVFGGIGIFNFNPTRVVNDTTYNLHEYGTEGQFLIKEGSKPRHYSRTNFCIPVGAGVKFRITERFDIRFEIGFRKTFTDYIDDVSTVYPDFDEMRSQVGEFARQLSDGVPTHLNIYKDPNVPYPDYKHTPGTQRGDKIKADNYVYSNLSLTYIIKKKEACPKFSK